MSSEPHENRIDQVDDNAAAPQHERSVSAETPVEVIVAQTVPPEIVALAQPSRLHPLSIFFDVSAHIRSLIIPAIIAVFSAASGSIEGLILAGIFFLMTLTSSMIRYFSLRYQIRDNELIVTEGIFFRRNRTVPVKRIQNIDLIQNVLHRVFGVAEVRLETAGGTQAEAVLRVLSLENVERLRQGIFNQERQTETVVQADTEEQTIVPSQTILAISPMQLLSAGLASNRGTILLGVLAGMYFQFDEQIERNVDFGRVRQLVPADASTFQLVMATAIGIAIVLLIFRLLGMAWYLLRFYGYELIRNEDDLRIRCGLFTKVSATVPRRRIQFISIHRNLIMRWMKLASIRIETAGGSGKSSEDAAKTVSSRWFIPVLPEDRVQDILVELRPDLQWREGEFDWRPISPLAPNRLTRIACFVAAVVTLAGGMALPPWGWATGLVALPLLIWYARRSAAAKRYARNDRCVVYRSGLFTKKTSVTFFEKIQTVRLDESPFDRRWGMASLCVDTAAAGPADHRIHIDYLTSEFARSEYNAIIEQSCDHAPVFG